MGRTREPEEDFGKPIEYDPSFNGPLKSRSCTDIICLLIFLVFFVAWIALGIFAMKSGDLDLLLVPRDSKGRRCGKDSDVKDKPYLLFHDLTRCIGPQVPFTGCKTPQVCIKKCPSVVYMQDGSDPSYSGDRDYCDDNNNCPKWYLPSESVQYRCFPANLDQLKDVANKYGQKFDELLTAIKNVKLFSDVEQIGQVIVKDVINSWWKILIGVGVAVVVCLLYIVMLRFIAGVMVWISIFGVIALLSAGIYFTQREYRNISSEETEKTTKKNLWLAGLIILSVILTVTLLVILFLRKRITLAIALIKEGSKAVSSVTSVLVFPIVPWILQAGVIAYALVVCLFLATTGKPIYRYKQCSELSKAQENEICDPNQNTLSDCTCRFIGTHETGYYKYAQAFNFIGFLWLAFFVSALGQMILAGVFAQWYWTLKKSTLPFFAVTEATLRTLRYHVGTLAFGSLIITICRLIRIALEYVDHKLKKYDNELTRAILCCLKCFFWCLEKFLKFINKNAYIMCAIHGKNFCRSAKDAFMLLMRNIIRVFVLDKVTDFLFFLSKLLITVGVGSLAYVCFATDLTTIDNSNINYGLVPVAVLMVITYLIASIFFNVYSMAVDTLFLCFLEDCERNNGSNEKPYYMSKNLMKIFGKKNKRS